MKNAKESEAEVLELKQRWRGADIAIRQRYMAKEMHVNHPDFIDAIKEISRRMRRCLNEDKGSAMLLPAPSGAGKSHLAQFLKKLWPDEHEETISRIRVVVFSMPSSINARTMGQSFLKAMGDASWHTGTVLKNDERIKELVAQSGTWLILIDNAHDIPERRKERGIRIVGNWIRDLIDNTKRFVVLLGTHSLLQVVHGNSQLKRRAISRINLDYFDAEKELPRLMRFLHELDKVLPLIEMCGLGEETIARKIGYASYGNPDFIFQLLIEAIGVAVKAGREQIQICDLESAFDMVFHFAGEGINPFKQGGTARILDQEGEPFHNFYDASNPNPVNAGKHESKNVDKKK